MMLFILLLRDLRGGSATRYLTRKVSGGKSCRYSNDRSQPYKMNLRYLTLPTKVRYISTLPHLTYLLPRLLPYLPTGGTLKITRIRTPFYDTYSHPLTNYAGSFF